MKQIQTPYYLLDEQKLKSNCEIIHKIKELSGAKVLLALKCFSSFAVFPLLKKYLDGTTSSSLYEARLGYEEFGKETQAYSVAYTKDEIKEIKKYASKIIFNSVSQLEKYYPIVKGKPIGLRVNPGVSYSHFDLADPIRQYSRLGTNYIPAIENAMPFIDGLMFHFNCENTDVRNIEVNLNYISNKYRRFLDRVSWVSLGGGMLFTEDKFPVDRFCKILKKFSKKHDVQIYLEPGEAVIRNAGQLVTTVIDITHNTEKIAIVDSSAEAHMLDLVIYRESPKIKHDLGPYTYHIAGRSCLAGDVFGKYSFNKPISIGDKISIENATGYSIVKRTWFNGLKAPSIVVKRLNGSIEIIKKFSYKNFKSNLS